MLLDEPFGALDPIVRDEVRNEFRRIQQQERLTAVMVTHDVAEALLLADLVAVMSAGRLLQVGPPHELLAKPADEFVATTITTPARQARRLAGQLEALTAHHDNGESR
jgi:osmoprotectant transport system ATP-binding protein